jgi:regulator of replication initiation timing
MKTKFWLWVVLIILSPSIILAQTSLNTSSQLQKLQQELENLRDENHRLNSELESLQNQFGTMQQTLDKKDESLEKTIQDVKNSTSENVNQALDNYWGEHRFLLSGFGMAQYHWADKGGENTFSAKFEPLFLFRVSDRLLFDAGAEFELSDDAETEVNLEFGQVDYLLNDYLTVVAGKYLLPFGDFYERIEPDWINKLVSTPLPFRHEDGLLPFNDVGVQLRGSLPLSLAEGTNLEYTLYVGNGPKYASDNRGATFEAANNVDLNDNKAFGARLGLRLLPISWHVGRLKLGASTYNGTWDSGDDRWLYAWGLDGVYQLGPWELRGEYLHTRRELSGSSDEIREGGYVQTSYKLAALPIPVLNRSELVFRYAAQHQPQNTDDDPPSFLRGRQYSFGYDYWLNPTTALKIEYDYDARKDESDTQEVFTEFVVGF